MPRNANPDYAVDPDRGSGSAAGKRAVLLDMSAHLDRREGRSGLRELDAMTENLPGLNRLQRDRERLIPRQTNAELGDPRMRRRLPTPGEVRAPLSARQRNARSKARQDTQRHIPLARLLAQRDLVTNPSRFRAVNDQLSEVTGDIQALPEADQLRVRRIDKAIQAYEKNNDRGHVVYVNVALPHYINSGNVVGFLNNHLGPGQQVAFDRYTPATHQLHETAGLVPNPDGRIVVFEIQTRRGAYLGNSDKKDNTRHLLPRGLELQVSDIHHAPYQAPDGSTGRRLVVQLHDITPDL